MTPPNVASKFWIDLPEVVKEHQLEPGKTKVRGTLEEYQYQKKLSKGEMKQVRKMEDIDNHPMWQGKDDAFKKTVRLYFHEVFILDSLRQKFGQSGEGIRQMRLPDLGNVTEDMEDAAIVAIEHVQGQLTTVYGMEDGPKKEELKQWLEEIRGTLIDFGVELGFIVPPASRYRWPSAE